MRRLGSGVINDAQAEANIKSSKRPRTTPRDVRKPRERTRADDEHWQTRQNALPFDTRGATMKPHEIEFAEQFISDGHTIQRWLPQGAKIDGKIAPRSDFEWLEGKLVELKRTSNKDTIKDYVKANLPKGKNVFMIDFGDRKPPQRVLRNLSKFTPNNPAPFELWGYWNGELARIK